MTPDDLLARVVADMRVAHALRDSERPDELTASSLGGCLSYAARTLLGEPKGECGTVWPSNRGTYVHDGIADDLTGTDPGFIDGRKRKRFVWRPGDGLPDISGAWDGVFLPEDDGVDGDPAETGCLCDFKTRPKAECRYHADHGPTPQECMQVATAAEAEHLTSAAVIYLPTDGDETEIVVCTVDVAHWAAEARAWLAMADVRPEYEALLAQGVNSVEARNRVLEPVPRDKPVSWCGRFCERFSLCREPYEVPADLEIPDPTMRQAAVEAEHWRAVRLDAAKREAAAKSMLTHVDGVVHVTPDQVVKVSQQVIGPTKDRRGSKRTVVVRRPG